MRSTRAAERLLVLAFLGMIAIPPLVQTVWELHRDGHVQALDLFSDRPTSLHLRAYEEDLEDSSWVGKVTRPWVQYAQFVWFKDGGEKTLIGRDGWLFYRPGVEYATQRPSAAQEDVVRQAGQAIVEFRNGLAKRGIHLLVVIAPNKETVYPEMLAAPAANLGTLANAQTRQLIAHLEEMQVEVVDLESVYAVEKRASASTPDDARSLYLAQDSHWSPPGVALAARAVADRIVELRWLERGAATFTRRDVVVDRVGDLAQMLQVPQLEELLPAERIVNQQVLDSDGRPNRVNDPHAEVLAMGDSFLRIYDQDLPGSAGFSSQLAYELQRPVAALVNDGGGTTLVRQELFRRPALLRHKRVVVWEFVERDIRFGTEGWQVVPLPLEEENGLGLGRMR